MSMLLQLSPIILIFVVMYFLMIRPQKKREKQVNEMRQNIKVGDEIVTIGGICGKIVKTKEETIVIQVGADKIKFEMMRWAVSKVSNSTALGSNKVSEPEPTEEEAKKALPKRMKKTVETPAAETTEKTEEKKPAAKPVAKPAAKPAAKASAKKAAEKKAK